MRIIKTVAVWALQILFGAMFVLVGVMRFQGFANEKWGLSPFFYF